MAAPLLALAQLGVTRQASSFQHSRPVIRSKRHRHSGKAERTQDLPARIGRSRHPSILTHPPPNQIWCLYGDIWCPCHPQPTYACKRRAPTLTVVVAAAVPPLVLGVWSGTTEGGPARWQVQPRAQWGAAEEEVNLLCCQACSLRGRREAAGANGTNGAAVQPSTATN